MRPDAEAVVIIADADHPNFVTDICRQFVCIIALANQLALHLNIGYAGDHYSDQEKIDLLMAKADMDWTMLADLQSGASAEIEHARVFLEVVQNG